MKKIILSIFLVLLLTTSAFAVNIYYLNEPVQSDVAPENMNGTVMVPLRAITEAMGMQVEWNQHEQKIVIIKDHGKVIFFIDNNQAKVVGKGAPKVIQLKVAPMIKNSRTLVPLRALAEAFHCQVDWDQKTQSVLVDSDKSVLPTSPATGDLAAKVASYIPADSFYAGITANDLKEVSFWEAILGHHFRRFVEYNPGEYHVFSVDHNFMPGDHHLYYHASNDAVLTIEDDDAGNLVYWSHSPKLHSPINPMYGPRPVVPVTEANAIDQFLSIAKELQLPDYITGNYSYDVQSGVTATDMDEQTTITGYEITVRSKGGDPQVEPVVARFVISNQGNVLMYYEPVRDLYFQIYGLGPAN